MSDKEIRKTPLLRFRAYEEAWRKYKLGDILTVKSGKDYKHLDKGEIPVYGTGGYMLSVNDKLSTVDAVGIGRKGTIDKPQLLNAPFWTVDTLFYMLPKRHFNLYYVYALASKINWKLYDESTGVPSLSKENIEKIVEMFPDSNEQIKIGILFKQIDEIIRLYQRELELLPLKKKTLLSKMFPKEGEAVPEVRFKGFADKWEQRKISNIAPLQRGFDLPASQMEEGEYPVIMSNGIGGYHNEYKVKGPGVITGRSGTIGKVHYIEGKYWPHNTSLWVTDFNGNYPKFIYHLYQRLDLSKFGTGSGVPTLNRNDVHDSKLLIPSINEQIRISAYFDYLDHIITLHQRKLEAIKKIKKTLLKYMFI